MAHPLGTSLTTSPRGCELLALEGEIALVMGERARRVAPAEAGGTSGS